MNKENINFEVLNRSIGVIETMLSLTNFWEFSKIKRLKRIKKVLENKEEELENSWLDEVEKLYK